MQGRAERSESTLEPERAPTHPWRRFWARQIDYMCFEFALLAGLLIAAPDLFDLWPEADSVGWLVASQVALTALWVIPEAVFLSSFGTTPGKWMLGISVHSRTGDLLSFPAALARAVEVWVYGSALGVYPLSLLAYRKSYRDLRKQSTTRWDSQLLIGFDRPRIVVLGLAGAFALAVNLISVLPDDDREYHDVTEAEIQATAKDLLTFYEDHDLELELLARPPDFHLSNGEVREYRQHLERGGSVLIVGGCDQNCSDLDIIAIDPEGRVLARDREADARPRVFLTPELTGEYRILLTMHNCDADWCMAGYAVLRSESLPPSGSSSSGTGFVVQSDGGILTANHVVEGATSISVIFPDGQRFDAKVDRRSEWNDLALLRVRVATPDYLPLAKPASYHVSDPVFVVGYPLPDQLGEELRFTEGSITSLSGSMGETAQLQISAPIQKGNSGGPVVSQDGHVVGVVTSSAHDGASLEQNGAVPQLVNWATKAEIALVLVESPESAWTAVSREEALVRARAATVKIVAEIE